MGILSALGIPTNKFDLFLRSVEVSSYIPGRIRLHSKMLVGSPKVEKDLLTYLRSYSELSEVETSTATGSILIKYTPQLLHTNEELTRAEAYIKEHAKNRK